MTGSLNTFAGLLRKVQPGEAVYLVGTRKSAGKTTALNTRVSLFSHRTLGLLTIGIDGEQRDLLFDANKPRVQVSTGTLVCTTDRALAASDASVAVLRTLPVRTSMGWLMLARVLRRGNLLLVGPETNAQVHGIVDALFALGADNVLVDGAFDRRTQIFARQPKQPSWFVLVAAPSAETLDTFIAETATQFALLSLPGVPGHLAHLAMPATTGAVTGDFPDGPQSFDSLESLVRYCGDGGVRPAAIALAGPLRQRHVPLLKRLAPCGVILSSGALAFLAHQAMQSLDRMGVTLYQRNGLRPLALLLNTARPQSGFVPADGSLSGLAQAVSPHPVMDLMHDCSGEARA